MVMTARTEAIYRALFSRILEVSDDSGTTTGGSTTTLEDTAKHWLTDWSGAIAHIFRDGKEYEIDVASNTTTELTFVQTLLFAVTAGLPYSLRRRLTLTDITDRSPRLLGAVDSLTKWGGTALTGRNISSDLANLDLALTTLRDAICAGSPDNKTLNDLYGHLATEATLTAQLNITLSALRDAICAVSPNNKTLNDLYVRLADTLVRDTSDRAARVLGQITDGTSAISPAAFGSGTHPRNIINWGGTALTGRDISSDIARLDIALSALRDAVCAAGADAKTLNDLYTRILEVQQNVYSQLIGADETVAQSITLDVAGRTLLDIYASASVAATFRLDVSNDNTNWISDYLTWAAVTEVKETHTNAFRYLRLKSDAAGAAGDLVSLYLTGGR